MIIVNVQLPTIVHVPGISLADLHDLALDVLKIFADLMTVFDVCYLFHDFVEKLSEAI